MKLDLEGCTVMPGLINAHDHLEFNLFPQLGRGPYSNATEWARDIYRPESSPIREQLRVPLRVRLWWGALKNLVSGVTTVCHHNPYEAPVFDAGFPIRVVRRYAWAHSLAFDPALAVRFRKAPKSYPFLVHCGEGTDASARRELRTLDELGALDARTVLIHGVAVAGEELKLLRRRRVALVWCPTSNVRMLGRTVSRAVLSSAVPIALGTDSALSAPVDLLDEMRVARKYLPAGRVYEMVSRTPAVILRLSRASRKGDWIAVRGDLLTGGQVAAVAVAGRIRLVDTELARQLSRAECRRFQRLELEGRAPVLVDANLKALRRATEKYLGREFCVAGKRVLA